MMFPDFGLGRRVTHEIYRIDKGVKLEARDGFGALEASRVTRIVYDQGLHETPLWKFFNELLQLRSAR
jgi:hypothetical protein